MTEYQKIAIGLLGLSHPEIYLLSQRAAQERAEASLQEDAPDEVTPNEAAVQVRPPAKIPGAGRRAAPASALLRGIKFAFAALLTGSRIVPLGDNRRLTKELGEYGARLHRCS
jgi:hypothetical protein